MSITLEDILPDEQQLRTVESHESVQHAINVMHQHDYDQLPVVDHDGQTSLDQVVTFQGILRGIQSFDTRPEVLQVRDVAQSVKPYAADADLLATLDDIQRDNFVLIVNEAGLLTGIVTTADTTVFFREYAQDLMQIEGIESSLKGAIRALYAGDDVGLKTAIEAVTDRAAEIRRRFPTALKAYLGKLAIPIPVNDLEAIGEAERKLGLPEANKEFKDLSFDEFTHVLLKHPNAPKLARAKDVAELRTLLCRVRDARNKLVHFRGRPTPEERRTIQFASAWLERNFPAAPAEQPSPPPAVVKPPMPSAATPEAEEDGEPTGTYAPLIKHLSEQSSNISSVTFTFHDVETILGKPLPRSAYEYRAWWANDPTHPQSAAWLEEGWRTTSLSMTEKRLTFVRTNDTENAYISFFAKLNSRLENEHEFPLRGISPQGYSWIILASLDWIKPESANINACFTRRKEFRVELYLDSGDRDANKQRFDELFRNRTRIEDVIGEPLRWQRLDEKRACRIAVCTKAQIFTDADNPILLEWAARKAVDVYRALQPEFPSSK